MTMESKQRPVQLNDRPPAPGPAFSIKSGAFGGEWDSERGDLVVPNLACNDE